MAWRNTLIVTADENETLTLKDLRNINVGDYLIPIVTGGDPKGSGNTEPAFVQGKEYEVLQIAPEGNPIGVVLASERGKWWLDFTEGYGKFFTLRKLTDDEQLGALESLPNEIVKLLYEHKKIPRSRIITELMQVYYTDDVAQMKKLRNDIMLAISLLLRSGKIEHSEKVGIYQLTQDTEQEMMGGKSKTNREKYEEGTF